MPEKSSDRQAWVWRVQRPNGGWDQFSFSCSIEQENGCLFVMVDKKAVAIYNRSGWIAAQIVENTKASK